MTAPDAPADAPTKPEPVKYWWFEGATVDALCKALTDNPGARIECHLVDSDPVGLNFHVLPKPVTPEPIVLNESHPCPPFADAAS